MDNYHNPQLNDNEIERALRYEMLKFYRAANRGREREEFERELDEIDRRRWGYPPLRSRRRQQY